jgi:hypothetical protein
VVFFWHGYPFRWQGLVCGDNRLDALLIDQDTVVWPEANPGGLMGWQKARISQEIQHISAKNAAHCVWGFKCHVASLQ